MEALTEAVLLLGLGRVILGIAAATGAGWTVSRAFTAGLTRREKFAWSLATGLLVQAVCLLAFFAFGARPRAWTLLASEALVSGLALAALRPPRAAAASPAVRDAGPRWGIVVLGGVAALAWLVFLCGALADGMWATDFLAIWGYKGKMIFLSSSVPRRLFEDPALAFGNPEYPLLVPLSLAGLARVGGGWNDQALALLYPACSAATLLALSGFLERRASRLSGAAAAALAGLCFFLYRPASVGTAEIPFALAAVLAAAAATDFLRSPVAGEVWRLSAGALFCASVKQEGALFAVILAAALWLRMRRYAPRRSWIAAAALVLPVAAHGLLLALLRGPLPSRAFDLTLLSPGRWGELPARFGAAIARVLTGEARVAIVPLVAVAIYFLVTRRGAADWLLPLFGVQLLFYVAAFTVSAFGPVYAVDSAFSRIAMSLFPAFTMVLGARLLPEARQIDAR